MLSNVGSLLSGTLFTFGAVIHQGRQWDALYNVTSLQSYYGPAAGYSTVFSTQHLLIGLIDFPACQPPLLQLLITMLDSGIGYLDRYVHSYTVSQRRGPFRCFNEPSAESLSAAGAVKRRHELGPFVQIKAKQFVRINGFIFFDTIVADKRRSLALGIFCCWAIRMALTGAAEGVSEARRPDGPGQSYGVCRGKAGVWRTDCPGFANRVKATLICKQHVKLNHAN